MKAEEILKKTLPHQFQYGWIGDNPVIEWEKAVQAMHEFAETEAVAFAEWIKECPYIYDSSKIYTTTELYAMFKEERGKE